MNFFFLGGSSELFVGLTCHIHPPYEVGWGGDLCVLLCKNMSKYAVHNLLCLKTSP